VGLHSSPPPEEANLLRSQIVISKNRRGGRRYLPYVFTEQGVAKTVTGGHFDVSGIAETWKRPAEFVFP
jgi:hypothetical protein